MKLQITVEGKIYEVEVEVLEGDESIGAPGYSAFQQAGLSTRSTPDSGLDNPPVDAWPNGERVCRSPITGLVIRVKVEAGQRVERNELILVLEAMKMETNVAAPGAGRVKSVNVAPGDSVKVNQVIVEFE